MRIVIMIVVICSRGNRGASSGQSVRAAACAASMRARAYSASFEFMFGMIFPHGHEAGVFVLLYDVRYRWKALSMGFPSVYSMPCHSDMASHRI